MINLDHIRDLIGEGNLKEALAELLKLLESSDRRTRKLRDGVIIVHSRFHEISRKETLGLIDTEDVLREKAQINDALLNLISDIETSVTPIPEVQSIQTTKKWWWLLLLIPAGLLIVFLSDKGCQKEISQSQILPSDSTITVPRQTASMSFTETTFDFGTVKEGARITHTFRFRNTGNTALQIAGVSGSSGCTVQDWPQDPVPSGGSGAVLVEFNSDGKTGSQKGEIYIQGNTSPQQTILTIQGAVRREITTQQPIARFRIENNGCKAPCKVKFTNSSEHAASCKWEFGDGQTELTNSPTHQYTNPGIYNVTLKAIAADGLNDFARQTVTINTAQAATTGEVTSANSWGWKRMTQSNLDDANNFLNGKGAYNGKVKKASITKNLGFNDNEGLQNFLGTTREAEVVMVGNKYMVFYKK